MFIVYFTIGVLGLILSGHSFAVGFGRKHYGILACGVIELIAGLYFIIAAIGILNPSI